MLIRKPHVAGTFYPEDPAELQQFCSSFLSSAEPPVKARAVVLPHAGYFYSGQTAGCVLARTEVPSRVFLIGPNHRARGAAFALSSAEKWSTPLGDAVLDTETARGLAAECHELKWDDAAHEYEHSLEVEVPLLLARQPDLKLVPLAVGTLDLLAARQVAHACGRFLQQLPEPFLVAVSTDMSHYEPDAATREKDRYAIEAILALDAEALVRRVKEHRITMCGFVPVFMLLVMKDFLGIRKASLVDYRTSADATGEKDRVVGYAGFIFE